MTWIFVIFRLINFGLLPELHHKFGVAAAINHASKLHFQFYQIPVPLPVLPSLADANPPDEHDSQQVVRFKRLRGQIFVQARLHLLTAVYEAVTHRVYGRTFALQADAEYWVTLHNLSMVWSPQTDPLTQSQPQSQPLSARVSCRFICWSSSSPETFHPHASGHMALSLRKVAKQNLGTLTLPA